MAALDLTPLAGAPGRPALDRRAQPGADRPRAGAAAATAPARRAGRQSRPALAAQADGAVCAWPCKAARAPIVAMHDLDLAARYADRLVLMDGRRDRRGWRAGAMLEFGAARRSVRDQSGPAGVWLPGTQSAGGSAIIAVKLVSAATLPSIRTLPANLQTLPRSWTSSTSILQQHSGLDRAAELGAVDRHEIDELAGAGEAERFDREHARSLRHRLDEQDSGHDRPAREMALEEGLVDRHRLDRDDPLLRDQLLDPVDEQEGVAMRQRRHHPPDIERADGGVCRVGAHRPWG